MRPVVLYSLPTAESGERLPEFDVSEAAEGIAAELVVTPVGVEGRLDEILAALQGATVVFNLVEAPLGRPDLEDRVAALFEERGVPFTGSGSRTLALCRRKDRARAALAAAGVPVPAAGDDAGFPCFVKPAGEDGSAGIDDTCVCADAAARDAAVARLLALGLGPAHVEAWLPGRELNVALWADREGTYDAVGEIRFGEGTRVLTWASKWDPASPDYGRTPSFYPAEIPPELRAAAVAAARGAARAVGARGYLRVDLRCDAAGLPHVIDVNPNPDVTPGAGLSRAVASAGWSWGRFVRAQVDVALHPDAHPRW